MAFGFCAQEYCFALHGALGSVALIAISLCCACAEGTKRLTRAMAGATFNFLPGLNSGGLLLLSGGDRGVCKHAAHHLPPRTHRTRSKSLRRPLLPGKVTDAVACWFCPSLCSQALADESGGFLLAAEEELRTVW